MINIQQEVIDGNINPYELLALYNSKELTRQDIESLGFVLNQNSGIFRKGIWSIGGVLLGYQNDRTVTINKEHDCRFYGTIENKSELVRVLKMIGVNE